MKNAVEAAPPMSPMRAKPHPQYGTWRAANPPLPEDHDRNDRSGNRPKAADERHWKIRRIAEEPNRRGTDQERGARPREHETDDQRQNAELPLHRRDDRFGAGLSPAISFQSAGRYDRPPEPAADPLMARDGVRVAPAGRLKAMARSSVERLRDPPARRD